MAGTDASPPDLPPDAPRVRPRGQRGQPQPVRAQLSPWPFAGLIALVSIFFLNAASILVAPWWAEAALLVIWLGFLLLGIRWFHRHPRLLLVLALVDTLLWFGALVSGGIWLGWHPGS